MKSSQTWRLDMEIAHLAEATERIVDGEKRIRKQQALIERLSAEGDLFRPVTSEGEKVLELFRATMTGWLAYRNLIEIEIARLDQAAPSVGVSSSMSISSK